MMPSRWYTQPTYETDWSEREPLSRWQLDLPPMIEKYLQRDWVKFDPESFSECQQPLMHVFLAISVHANLHLTTNSSTFVSLLSQPCTARTDWIRLLKTSHLLAGFPATFAAENPAAKYKQIQMYICMTSLEVSFFVNLLFCRIR